MSGIRISTQAFVRTAVAVGALAATTVAVHAGGLAVREQSTSSQGASFAGSAAGGDLSSMFWNPAAAGLAPSGFYTESHYALVIPDASLTGTAAGPANAFPSSADIGSIALIPASYASYRVNRDLVLALSINSPFGLATKPDPYLWQGSPVGQTAKMFTANVAPTLSYQIAPGLFIGAGVQFEYMSLKFKFLGPTGTATADIADDVNLGLTGGILWQPSKSTTIGLGIRSSVSHKMDGTLAVPVLGTAAVSATFDTPEIATLSVRQAIAPNLRLLGTVEWTNWSRFGVIPIVGSGPVTLSATDRTLPGNWHDSWLFSGGLEYDYNQKLTLRTGVAFEKSPIQNADERLIQVPDSDRWWASAGLTYKWSEKMAFDFAYTHIFFDDAPFVRTGLTGVPTLTGKADQSADIVSVSVKNKW